LGTESIRIYWIRSGNSSHVTKPFDQVYYHKLNPEIGLYPCQYCETITIPTVSKLVGGLIAYRELKWIVSFIIDIMLRVLYLYDPN
jgi:hypothetical protein